MVGRSSLGNWDIQKDQLMAARKILSKVESVPHSEAAKLSSTRHPRSASGLASPSVDKPGKRASVGRRWKFRRNLVIYIANQHGASQRMLADVFDLPHSRIAAILKELRTKYGQTPQRSLD